MGSHLQYPPHSDAYRLTSTSPKMILFTYKSDAHPGVPGTGQSRHPGRVPSVRFEELSLRKYEDMVSVLLSRELQTHRGVGSAEDKGRNCYFSDDQGMDVYELRNFTCRMDLGRRRQVERSLDRPCSEPPAPRLSSSPIDPTPAEQAWFDSLQASASAKLDWKGRAWLDEKLSQYPGIMRYFFAAADEVVRLHDGIVEEHVRPDPEIQRPTIEPLIFLSHSGIDADLANRIAREIETYFDEAFNRKVVVFNTSLPEYRFAELTSRVRDGDHSEAALAGYQDELRRYLGDYLARSSAYLLLITRETLRRVSGWVQWEASEGTVLAAKRNLPFVPFVADANLRLVRIDPVLSPVKFRTSNLFAMRVIQAVR